MTIFNYQPSPQILQWLAAGQLANRLPRSLRLWVLLTKLYGPLPNWETELPLEFTYAMVRDRLFAPRHGKSDNLTAKELVAGCADRACICHQPMADWLFSDQSEGFKADWTREVVQLTGIETKELNRILQLPPFATVHRSIRDDLKQLAQMGWLQRIRPGCYTCPPVKQRPLPPTNSAAAAPALDSAELWELLQAIESVSFVQPTLAVVANSLWEQLVNSGSGRLPTETEPSQRIFLHFDYILSAEMRDRVDTYQEQLEQLWGHREAGAIQFDYWVKFGHKIQVITYPVCLHYVRRAKYLSAYGIDPQGNFGWHNYRLDRIASSRLHLLPWGDPNIPAPLKKMRRTGNLPTPEQVETELDAAWGFNFYFPRRLLILRFPQEFARWYVDNTIRHRTFQPLNYPEIPSLIAQKIDHPKERQQLLKLIQQRSPTDSYYRAWIRLGDINVVMRLRDWRPNGEVIAPLSYRELMAREVEQERSHYQSDSQPID